MCMAAQDLKTIAPGYAFKWTNELTEQLILWRSANKSLFTGMRNAALKGFEMFIKEMRLEGKVTVAFVKKKWENLKQKYKELKNQPTGRSTEGGMTAANWKWYRIMGEAVESSHSITSLAAGSPSTPGGTVFTLPSEEGSAASSSSVSSTPTSSSTALAYLQQYKQEHMPMVPQDFKDTTTGFVIKWTDELTEQLILWRGANKSLFTGKRNAALNGFDMFIKVMGLEGKVTVPVVKKKWENLKQKYKLLKNPPTGRSTEGEMTAANWKWYGLMDEAVQSSHSITSLAVDSLSSPGGTVFSFPSSISSLAVGSPSSPGSAVFNVPSSSCLSSTPPSSSTAAEPPCTSPAPKRAKKEPDWLLAIKELERREEARDARQAEWERAMMEREKRRDQEMMEREERRDQEMREREERRDREMREREERLVAENREREDKQAKEAAAREERFLALMEFLVKK